MNEKAKEYEKLANDLVAEFWHIKETEPKTSKRQEKLEAILRQVTHYDEKYIEELNREIREDKKAKSSLPIKTTEQKGGLALKTFQLTFNICMFISGLYLSSIPLQCLVGLLSFLANLVIEEIKKPILESQKQLLST